MGIQINGNTDNISATDGGLTVSDLEINQSGISTFNNHIFLQKDAAYIDFKQTDGTQTGYIQSRTTDFRFNSYGARPVKFGTNDVERVRITSDGKIGIGNNNPSYPLVLTYTNNTTYSSSNFIANGLQIENNSTTDNTASGIFFTAKGSGANAGAAHINCIRTANGSGTLTFSTRHNVGNHTERFRIQSSGNALFTTNQVKLYNATDNSNTYFYTENTGAGNAGIKMKNQDGEWTIIANDSLRFIDDDTSADRLRIHSGGKLQTYNTFTSSASSFLQLGDAQGVFEVQMSDGTGGADVINHVKKRFVSKNTYGLNITSRSTLGGSYTKAGEASIKFYYPSAGGGNQAGGQLEFWTNQNGYAGTNESKRMQIDNGGNIGAPNGNNIYNASDERLKENMVELTNGLDKIKKLKPISFNWKDGWDECMSGKKEYGFGAQTTQVVDEMLVEPFGTEDALLNGDLDKYKCLAASHFF